MTLPPSLPLRAIASNPMYQWFLEEDQPYARDRGRCRRRRRRRRRPLLAAQPRQHRHHAAEQFERQPVSFIIDGVKNTHEIDHRSAFVLIQLSKTQHAPASASGDRDCVAVAVAVAVADNAHGGACPTCLPDHLNAHGFDAIALNLSHPTATVAELRLRLRGWP
jgi:hypothetical protein